MNYQLCENITWKESLLLMKNDIYAQRVYTTLWGMTKDVLYLTLTFCGLASFGIMVPALLNPLDTWWETTCVILFVPLGCIFPMIWIGAYFGWYKNIRKINFTLKKLINSLDGADSIKEYMQVAYTLNYKEKQFHVIFEENQNPGQTVTIAKGQILIALVYHDPQERSTEELFKEIASYLVGKLAGNFSLSGNALMYRLKTKPLPSTKAIEDVMNQLIYLAQRFNLKVLTDEGDD